MIIFFFFFVLLYSMQTQMINQNVENSKKADKTFADYNNIQNKYNKLRSQINTIQNRPKTSKASESLKRDEINEIYEFTHQFDGTTGISALTFRKNVKNYVNYVKSNVVIKNYLESRIITRVIKGLTGNAKFRYSQRQGDRFDNLGAFYKWFDEEFRLSELRSKLHTQLQFWQIDPNTNKLSIVQEYRRILKLFHLTETVTSQTVLDLTQITTPMSINAIIKAIQRPFPKVYAFIDNRFKNKLRMPNTFTELQDWIKDACIYIETSNKNSINKPIDPTKMGTVIAISAHEYPDLYNSQAIAQYTQSPNYNRYQNNDRYNQNRSYNNRDNYNNQRGRFNGNTSIRNGSSRPWSRSR